MQIDIAICSYHRKEKLKRCINSILENENLSIKVVIFYDCEGLAIPSRFVNNYLKDFDSDIFINISDDFELNSDCIEKGAKCLLDTFPDLDGVVGLNPINIPRGIKVPIVGRKFINRFPRNQLYCPDYMHFHVDAELNQYANEVSKFKVCKEAKLIHYHPNYSKENKDEAHNRIRIKSVGDHEIRKKRMKLNLLWGREFTLVKNEQ